MKKGLVIVSGLLLAANAQAAIVTGNVFTTAPGNNFMSGNAISGYTYLAQRVCKDMSCVQQTIKVIDSQIADLIARRLAFVQRAAQLKNSTIVSDNVQANPNVIAEVTKQAQAQGVPPEIAQSVFTEIDKQSLAYENKYEGMTPMPSPNSLGVPTQNVSNPVKTPSIVRGTGLTPAIVAGAPQP